MMNQKREAAVWERVMAASAQCPQPAKAQEPALSPQQVLELWQAEQHAAATYNALAMKTGGRTRQTLLQLSRMEQEHEKKLAAVYYLMTGVRPKAERPVVSCSGIMEEEVRKLFEAEAEAARCYYQLAEQKGSFGAAFHALGQEEQQHSSMLLALLQSRM